jgi:hypothetical protein
MQKQNFNHLTVSAAHEVYKDQGALGRWSLPGKERADGNPESADYKQSGKPDGIAGRQRVGLQDGEVWVRGIDAAGSLRSRREILGAGFHEIAFRGPSTAAPGHVVAGARGSTPLVAEDERMAEFRRGMRVMHTLLDFRTEDHAGDFRPGMHFPRSQIAPRHQPDEETADAGER